MGINAQGRGKRLSVNYRNTQQILDFAWEVSQALQADEDDSVVHVRVKPEKADRSGAMPVYADCREVDQERETIVEIIRSFRAEGIPDEQIEVLYPKVGDGIYRLVEELERFGPIAWITRPKDDYAKDHFMQMPGIRLSTIHSAKGLEFDAVIVSGVDRLGTREREDTNAANLLYVGLTRASKRLAGPEWRGPSRTDFAWKRYTPG